MGVLDGIIFGAVVGVAGGVYLAIKFDAAVRWLAFAKWAEEFASGVRRD